MGVEVTQTLNVPLGGGVCGSWSNPNSVKTELVELWEYAGYGDILKAPTTITKHILGLHFEYKQVIKCDTSRRGTETYKKKEAAFLSTLDNLFDITNASLRSSNLITEEDRDFLLNHWQNTISSTRDLQTKVAVEKKLARAEKSLKFALSPTTPQASSSLTLEPSPNGDSKNSISSTEEYTPKRFCSRPSGFGTTVDISKDWAA